MFQTTHTVDSTYFPSSRSEFDNGVYHIFATTADYATNSRWSAGLQAGSITISSIICALSCVTLTMLR